MPGFWSETGQITSPAGTGNQSYTFSGAGNGLVPKAVIFFASFIGAGSTGAHDWKMFGFTTGATAARNQCHCFQNVDGVGTQDVYVGFSETACIFKNDNTATTTDLAAALVSFDADGFTLNWTTTASGISIQYVAIGGDQLSVFADNFDTGTGTGNIAETGAGFQPKAAIFAWSKRSTTGSFATQDGALGVGVATSPTADWTWLSGGDDAALTNEFYGELSDDACVKTITESSGAIDSEFSLVSFDADGFTIDPVDAPGTSLTVSYLLLGGDINVAAGTDTAPASASTKATAVGFNPQFVMLAGFNTTAVDNDAMAAADRAMSLGFGIPAADSRCCFWIEDNASDPIDCNAGTLATKCISIRSPTAIGTVSAEADIDASASDSFVLNWTTAGTAFRFGYLAIAANQSGAGSADGVGAAAAASAATKASTASASAAGAAAAVGKNASIPEAVAAGVGALNGAGTTISVPYPAGIQAGDYLILHVHRTSAVSGTASATGFTAENADAGNSGNNQQWLSRTADGSESGSVTVNVTSGNDAWAGRMYRIAAPVGGGTWSRESGSAANGTDATVEIASVTSAAANRLAISLIAMQTATTVGDATGETGGDYTEAFAEYSTGNHLLQIQTAPLSGAGTISGGVATLGTSGSWINRSFALYAQASAIQSGDGAADAAGAAAAVGTGIREGVGSAAAVGAAAATSTAVKASTASASASGAAAGVGASTVEATAAASADGAAAATSNANKASTAASTAAGAAAAVGTGIKQGAASAAAIGAATATGASIAQAVASAAAAGVGAAVGAAVTDDPCAHGVEFDGSTNYLDRGGNLSGMVDGPVGSLSFWVRLDTPGTNNTIISTTPNGRFKVERRGGNNFRLTLQDAGGGSTFQIASGNGYGSTGWINVLMSWDANAGAGSKICHIYINDIADAFVVSDASSAFNVDYDEGSWFIGALAGPTNFLDGGLAAIWFKPEFIDFSVLANRRDFVTASLKGKKLGFDGSTPTGAQPPLYLNGPAADITTNRGSGGDFSAVGSLADTADDPVCDDGFESGDGAAAGTGAATGVSEAIKASAASLAGAGAASGVSAATKASVAAAAASGAATGAGQSISQAVGSAAATGAAAATATAQKASVGNAAGTGAGAAVGAAESGAANAAGVGAAAAVGTGIRAGVGSAAGAGAATATGTAIWQATASAAGTGAGAATGTGIRQAVGNAAGTGAATATGSAFLQSVGLAAAIGDSAAIGAAIRAAIANAAGVGVALGRYVPPDGPVIIYEGEDEGIPGARAPTIAPGARSDTSSPSARASAGVPDEREPTDQPTARG